MTQAFHKFWLRITAIVIGFGGPILFLGTMEPLSEPARLGLDFLSWPVDGAQSYADPTVRFLSALTGGFLLGWGVTVWVLSGAAHDACPEGVRKAVVYGLCAWFCLDSAGSIASGNASNLLFNIVVILTAVGPMWVPPRNAKTQA